MTSPAPSTALVTGGSAGLGLALAQALSARGWRVVLDGRDPGRLASAAASLAGAGRVTAIAGDVTDPAHRAELVAAVGPRLDLLVNNASVLGASPLPAIVEHPAGALAEVLAVGTLAPLELLTALVGPLRLARGCIVNVSSDAAVAAYPGWGGYGAAKAALDHASAVLALELPELRVYAVDPGDMRTALRQSADPAEDIAGLPMPASVVPAFLALIEGTRPSGRYVATDLLAGAA